MFKFYHYFNNYENIYFATTLLVCFGIIISSFEYLVIHKEFRSDGVFAWKVFSSTPNYLNSFLPLKKFDFLFDYYGFLTLHILRIICCLFLPFIDDIFFKAILIAIVAISSLIFSFRNIIGNDGSDQMNSLICITLFISFISNDAFIFKIGLIFIACQSILSYVIAGVAKVLSTKWRSGIAIPQIMNTRSYGHEKIAEYLFNAPPIVNYLMSWQIIIFESLFFMVAFLPHPWFFIFLIWGILFHLYNAIAMGLNSFFWSFLATYPSIIFLNYLITT